jgi:DNA primase
LARYSEELINEIFAENDIVDYVSQYVKLKKSGRDYSGLCPFHSEKTPSFHVSQDKQLFHCFGCGASGNLVQFVMRSENLDFVEALKLLADRAGIILPEDDSMVMNNEVYEKKKRFYHMNAVSARFYYSILTHPNKGKAALSYLLDRKILPKTITHYGLGYAPQEFDRLLNHLQQQGFSIQDIIEAGLAVNKNGRVYDKFRGRVMFPIIDLRGNVIGFGGRIIEAPAADADFKPPKYLNSSETLVFNKGNNLFSLNFAKKSKSDQMLLVEGYMDVISVYQAGIDNVVATLGTALTENQAKLILKYCQEVLICYDSDEAGQAAKLRAIDIINAAGGKSRVMVLKGAKDPDEYIKKNGVELFEKAMRESMPSTEFKLSLVKRQYDISDTDEKVKFVNDAAEALVGIQDAVEVDAYVKKLSEETEISKEAIYSAYKKRTAKKSYSKILTKPEYEQKKVKASSEQLPIPPRSDALVLAEKRLLNLISQKKTLYLEAKEKMPESAYSTDIHRQLAHLLYTCWERGREPEPAKIILEFDRQDAEEVSSIFYNMEIYDDERQTIKELITAIQKEKLSAQIKAETDPETLKKLLELKTKLGEDI